MWILKWHKMYRENNTPENYAAAVSRDARPMPAPLPGDYPTEPDNGWRYGFRRTRRHDKLCKRYGLTETAEQGTEFERALRVMQWFCANTYYNGMAFWSAMLPDNTPTILRYAYRKPFRRAINCRHKAVALADCLLAVGIDALPIGMIRDGCSHVIVHVWLTQEQRWVMFDPSFDAYITDETGHVLNIIEIAQQHRAGKPLIIAQYHLNGAQDCRDCYLSYFMLGSIEELLLFDHTPRYTRKKMRNSLLPAGAKSNIKRSRAITASELLAAPKK